MKRLYKWMASASLAVGMILPATVTCNVPDINVKLVPTYGDDYYDDDYYEDDYHHEDYYYDDGCYDCGGGWFDFGFDYWGW